jgi:hypothetical protein
MKPLLISLIVAVFVLAVTSPSFGAKKPPDRIWQMGKVLDSQRSQEFAGTVDRPGAVINGRRITNDARAAVYATQQILVIESDTYTYTVSEVSGRAGPANVTVNGRVVFAIEGTILYVLDDDGKEHKTEITKKALRIPEKSQPSPKQ